MLFQPDDVAPAGGGGASKLVLDGVSRRVALRLLMPWTDSCHPLGGFPLLPSSEGKAEGIGNGFEGDFALYHIQALGQGRIIYASLFPTLVG